MKLKKNFVKSNVQFDLRKIEFSVKSIIYYTYIIIHCMYKIFFDFTKDSFVNWCECVFPSNWYAISGLTEKCKNIKYLSSWMGFQFNGWKLPKTLSTVWLWNNEDFTLLWKMFRKITILAFVCLTVEIHWIHVIFAKNVESRI